MPPALFARYPLSRQALVVFHDVAAVTVALPLAIMLRENQLLSGHRLVYILGCLPLLALATLAAAFALGHYRAVWRYMGIGEITRLATFVLLAVLLFWTGQFLVDRLAHLPRSGPAIQFLVAIFLLIGARIAYSEYCRWTESPSGSRPHRQPLLLVGSGDGTALFIQMLGNRRTTAYEPIGNHDWNDPAFRFFCEPIEIGDGCWVGAGVRVGPGEQIASGLVQTGGVALSASNFYEKFSPRLRRLS